MTKEQLKDVCEYIFEHEPEGTDFDIISEAIREVTGYEACTAADIAKDDAWMLDEKDENTVKGVRTAPGVIRTFTNDEIGLLYSAVNLTRKVNSFMKMADKYKEQEKTNVISDEQKAKGADITKITPITPVQYDKKLNEINPDQFIFATEASLKNTDELKDMMKDPNTNNKIPTDDLGDTHNI